MGSDKDSKDKIPVADAKALTTEFESLLAVLAKPESPDTWEQHDVALLRLAGIVRGGACKPPLASTFVALFRDPTLVSKVRIALESERTHLACTTMDALSATARLGPLWEPLVPAYLPSLLTLLARANKVYVSRASATLRSLIRNTGCSNVVPIICVSFDSPSATARLGCAEALLCCLGGTPEKEIGAVEEAEKVETEGMSVNKAGLEKKNGQALGDAGIEGVMRRAGRDRDPKIRSICRRIWEIYRRQWPERAALFAAPLTPTIKRVLAIPKDDPLFASGLPKPATLRTVSASRPLHVDRPKPVNALSKSTSAAVSQAKPVPRPTPPVPTARRPLTEPPARHVLSVSAGPSRAPSRTAPKAPVPPVPTLKPTVDPPPLRKPPSLASLRVVSAPVLSSSRPAAQAGPVFAPPAVPAVRPAAPPRVPSRTAGRAENAQFEGPRPGRVAQPQLGMAPARPAGGWKPSRQTSGPGHSRQSSEDKTAKIPTPPISTPVTTVVPEVAPPKPTELPTPKVASPLKRVVPVEVVRAMVIPPFRSASDTTTEAPSPVEPAPTSSSSTSSAPPRPPSTTSSTGTVIIKPGPPAMPAASRPPAPRPNFSASTKTPSGPSAPPVAAAPVGVRKGPFKPTRAAAATVAASRGGKAGRLPHIEGPMRKAARVPATAPEDVVERPVVVESTPAPIEGDREVAKPEPEPNPEPETLAPKVETVEDMIPAAPFQAPVAEEANRVDARPDVDAPAASESVATAEASTTETPPAPAEVAPMPEAAAQVEAPVQASVEDKPEAVEEEVILPAAATEPSEVSVAPIQDAPPVTEALALLPLVDETAPDSDPVVEEVQLAIVTPLPPSPFRDDEDAPALQSPIEATPAKALPAAEQKAVAADVAVLFEADEAAHIAVEAPEADEPRRSQASRSASAEGLLVDFDHEDTVWIPRAASLHDDLASLASADTSTATVQAATPILPRGLSASPIKPALPRAVSMSPVKMVDDSLAGFDLAAAAGDHSDLDLEEDPGQQTFLMGDMSCAAFSPPIVRPAAGPSKGIFLRDEDETAPVVNASCTESTANYDRSLLAAFYDGDETIGSEHHEDMDGGLADRDKSATPVGASESENSDGAGPTLRRSTRTRSKTDESAKLSSSTRSTRSTRAVLGEIQ